MKKLEKDNDITNYLSRHDISSDYRSKMVDWMVEVLTTFKCSDSSFFLAVSLMDRFFAKSERQLTGADLHLTGVVSMFIATKYEDIIPLLMRTVLNKVGHGKFKQETIEEREIEMLATLSFKVGCPTVLEFIDRYLEECKLGDLP